MAALQHDDIGILTGGFHELLVHRLDGGQVLSHHGFQRAASLLHVPQGAAQDAHVGVGLHKDLNVQQIPQGLVLKDQDPLHDYHLGGLDLHRFISTVVDGVIVDGAVNGLAPLQRLQIGDHQLGIKGVRVVVILPAALREGAVLPLIVIVVMDHADIAAEAPGQVLRQCGFAGTGAAGDADENGVHGDPSLIFFPFIIESHSVKSKKRCKKTVNFQQFQLTGQLLLGYHITVLSRVCPLEEAET